MSFQGPNSSETAVSDQKPAQTVGTTSGLIDAADFPLTSFHLCTQAARVSVAILMSVWT